MSSPLAEIPAYILAGGAGTRLLPATRKPKAIAAINGTPFLFFLLDSLERAGLKETVLCLGHGADEVQAVAGCWNGRMRLRFSCESQPLGTGGALKLALTSVLAGTVLVLNGDSYSDVDLRAFLAWHNERSSQCSVLLSQVADCARYSRVQLDEHCRIERFTDKDGCGPGLINAGTYLLETNFFFRHAPKDEAFSFEHRFLQPLSNVALHGYCGAKRFIDIGTPASYAAGAMFFSNSAPADGSDEI